MEGFFVLANLSSSAAASDRIVSLSGVASVGKPGGFGDVGPRGVLGEPDFLWRRELKKFAKTPSPPGVPTTLLSNWKKKIG